MLERLDAILEAAGARRDHLVRVGVYLSQAAYFPEMDRVYRQWWGDGPMPARTTIVVELPRPDLLVEVDGLAYLH